MKATFISGDSRPRIYNASASYPFLKGDLLFLHSDNTVRPAAAIGVMDTLANGQLVVAEKFVGVAGVTNGKQSNEILFNLNQNYEAQVVVFTGGIWEFECPSQTFGPNDRVGFYVAPGVVPTDSQKVTAASTSGSGALANSIGVVAPTAGQQAAAAASTSMTRICVEIQPMNTRMGGLPNAASDSKIKDVLACANAMEQWALVNANREATT